MYILVLHFYILFSLSWSEFIMFIMCYPFLVTWFFTSVIWQVHENSVIGWQSSIIKGLQRQRIMVLRKEFFHVRTVFPDFFPAVSYETHTHIYIYIFIYLFIYMFKMAVGRITPVLTFWYIWYDPKDHLNLKEFAHLGEFTLYIYIYIFGYSI